MDAKRLTEIKTLFLDALTSGASLNKLCDITSEAIDLPVALALTTRTLIAKSASYTDKYVDEYISGPEFCTKEEAAANTQNFNKSLSNRKATIYTFPYVHHKRVTCGCFYNNRLLAILDCPLIKPIKEEEVFPVLEEASKVFIAAMQMYKYISANTRDSIQTYIRGILSGDQSSFYQQKDPASLAIDPDVSWILMWVEPDDMKHYLELTANVRIFCSQVHDIWYVEYEDGIVIVTYAEHSEYPPQLARALTAGSKLAVSDPFHSLLDLKEELPIAQRSLSLARQEGFQETIVFVHNYKFPLALLSFTPKDALDRLFHNSIMHKIKQYDAEHCTEYYKTIRSFLLNHMDQKKMSEDLNIHRNTTAYRMHRITDIFGIDLTDCREITAMYLSLFEDLAK